MDAYAPRNEKISKMRPSKSASLMNFCTMFTNRVQLICECICIMILRSLCCEQISQLDFDERSRSITIEDISFSLTTPYQLKEDDPKVLQYAVLANNDAICVPSVTSKIVVLESLLKSVVVYVLLTVTTVNHSNNQNDENNDDDNDEDDDHSDDDDDDVVMAMI
ncbi:hypothetical protein GQX74_009086 [Glossina fuscipes]|nr:hypothetical protein GQX74_009086 [Glossina fuscipes]